MTPVQGLLDTNILILRAGIDPDELPDEMMISAITTAELSVGVLDGRRSAGTRPADEDPANRRGRVRPAALR